MVRDGKEICHEKISLFSKFPRSQWNSPKKSVVHRNALFISFCHRYDLSYKQTCDILWPMVLNHFLSFPFSSLSNSRYFYCLCSLVISSTLIHFSWWWWHTYVKSILLNEISSSHRILCDTMSGKSTCQMIFCFRYRLKTFLSIVMWQFTETLGEGAYGEYVIPLTSDDWSMPSFLELFWRKMSIQMNLLLWKSLISIDWKAMMLSYEKK